LAAAEQLGVMGFEYDSGKAFYNACSPVSKVKMNTIGRLHYQFNFKDIRTVARMSNKQGQALLEKALSGQPFSPSPTTPLTSATHVPYVDLLDSDTEELTPKKTAQKGGMPAPSKSRKPVVVSDSESDESEDIQAVTAKKKKAVKEEGTSDKARKGGRRTSTKGKKVVETESESEDTVEIKEHTKRPRKEVMAAEARKKKAADNIKIKKEVHAPKPFSQNAREEIRIALDKAAAPMKGRKGN
jgi:hypothetical protein